MSVLVIVEFPLKPQHVGELKAIMSSPDGLAKTRQHDGCEGVTGAIEPGSNTMVLAETWTTKEKHQEYLKWRTETGMMDLIGPMLSGEVSVRYADVF